MHQLKYFFWYFKLNYSPAICSFFFFNPNYMLHFSFSNLKLHSIKHNKFQAKYYVSNRMCYAGKVIFFHGLNLITLFFCSKQTRNFLNGEKNVFIIITIYIFLRLKMSGGWIRKSPNLLSQELQTLSSNDTCNGQNFKLNYTKNCFSAIFKRL